MGMTQLEEDLLEKSQDKYRPNRMLDRIKEKIQLFLLNNASMTKNQPFTLLLIMQLRFFLLKLKLIKKRQEM